MNLDHEDWTLNDEQTLKEAGCGMHFKSLTLILENETTLSFYNYADYEEFKANPEEKWM
jgi:Uncharacterized conserved protein (DUF2340)